MRYCQLGNGVISHGAMTPWNTNAMPSGKCGWYPFHGQVNNYLDIDQIIDELKASY